MQFIIHSAFGKLTAMFIFIFIQPPTEIVVGLTLFPTRWLSGHRAELSVKRTVRGFEPCRPQQSFYGCFYPRRNISLKMRREKVAMFLIQAMLLFEYMKTFIVPLALSLRSDLYVLPYYNRRRKRRETGRRFRRRGRENSGCLVEDRPRQKTNQGKSRDMPNASNRTNI